MSLLDVRLYGDMSKTQAHSPSPCKSPLCMDVLESVHLDLLHRLASNMAADSLPDGIAAQLEQIWASLLQARCLAPQSLLFQLRSARPLWGCNQLISELVWPAAASFAAAFAFPLACAFTLGRGTGTGSADPMAGRPSSASPASAAAAAAGAASASAATASAAVLVSSCLSQATRYCPDGLVAPVKMPPENLCRCESVSKVETDPLTVVVREVLCACPFAPVLGSHAWRCWQAADDVP